VSTKTETKLVIDNSPKDDLLRINFNIRHVSPASARCGTDHCAFPCISQGMTCVPLCSFVRMSCEHVTLDVSDSLGSVRFPCISGRRRAKLLPVGMSHLAVLYRAQCDSTHHPVKHITDAQCPQGASVYHA
jgi:hypothetical protein